eukprot:751488-Hanusia_phi.AAC.3
MSMTCWDQRQVSLPAALPWQRNSMIRRPLSVCAFTRHLSPPHRLQPPATALSISGCAAERLSHQQLELLLRGWGAQVATAMEEQLMEKLKNQVRRGGGGGGEGGEGGGGRQDKEKGREGKRKDPSGR